MSQIISFADRFDTGSLRTRLVGYNGRSADGDHVIACEDLNHAGEVVNSGTRLFFRNNDPADIQMDNDGYLAGDYVVSRDGLWITKRGGNVDTTGYGMQKVAK